MEAGPSNDEWFQAHVLELVEKYPNQWVAIAGGAVLCSSASRWRAKSEAKRLAAGREFSLYFIEPSMLQMGFGRGAPRSDEPSKPSS